MIKKIKGYYKRKGKMLDSFVKNSKYLVSGRYKFDKTLNYIYLNDDNIRQKASNMLDNGYLIITDNKSIPKHIIIYILKVIFYRKLKVNNNKLEKDIHFKGNIFVPSVDCKEVKIFDLVGGKVASIFLQKQRYKEKIYNYKHFNDYFPMPSIISEDPDNLAIIEELINYKVNALWDNNDYSYVMQDILDRTIKYFNVVSEKQEYVLKTPIQILQGLPKDDVIINYIKEKINPSLKDTTFPFIKLHGDMWASNILIEDVTYKIRYIDLEHSKQLIFFYDIFLMMWIRFFYKNDSTYIEEFLNGKYDNYFNDIFKQFNIEYNEQYRMNYFNIFFLIYFEERWINSGKTDKINLLNKYKDLIKDIKLVE